MLKPLHVAIMAVLLAFAGMSGSLWAEENNSASQPGIVERATIAAEELKENTDAKIDSAVSAVENMTTEVKEEVGEATESVKQKSEEIAADAVNAAQTLQQEAVEKTTAVVETLKEKAEEVAADAVNAAQELKQDAVEKTSAAVEALQNVTAEAAKEIPVAATAAGSKLQQAIAKAPTGTEAGHVDTSKPAGFLGIPGGPQVNLILALVWAIWVGWIFSTVGAFGGVMAGVGHMTVFGLGAYAKGFKGTAPELNKTLTDSIRASNQFLVGLSALISSINYGKMGRLVLPLGLALGIGSLLGAWGSATLTAGKVSFSQYQGYFGLFVLLLGCYLLWETSPAGQASKQKSKAAAQAFEAAVKSQKGGSGPAATGVKILGASISRVNFTFCGVEFSFNPLLPVVGGIVIAAVAAFLGVGGGFMLVPFLTSITQLPMYLAAGTSALAVLVSMITSIVTLMTKGVQIDWALIGTEMVGIAIGSIVGPHTSKYFSDKWLKRLFIVLAFYVGVDYVLRGFFNYRIFG